MDAPLAFTASAAAHTLSRAAAPIFELFALCTAFDGGRVDLLCVSLRDASPLDGMTVIYAPTSAFHATPQLTRISRR